MAAADSRARTAVVPTATTRSAPGAGGHGGGRHRVALGVDHVLLGGGRGDRAEGVEADGQVDAGHGGPGPPAGVEELRGEVQAGGGGGRRPLAQRSRRRVHRLVALRVAEGAVDVGRQGHGPGPLHHRGVDAAGPGAGRPSSAPPRSHRPRPPAARPPDSYSRVGSGSRRPGRTSASHADRRPSDRFEQQHLGAPPGGLDQVQPGGQHPGVVDHHHVAGPQQPRAGRPRWRARSAPSPCRPGPTSSRAALRGSTGSWAMGGSGRPYS